MKTKTKWIVYSRHGLQSHGFETANKVNFLTCNLKNETLYDTMEEAKSNTDEFYSDVCEVSSLYAISKHILH